MRTDIPKIEYRKIYGLCEWEDKSISIDPRQTEKQLLNTIIHEAVHYALESCDEEVATAIGDVAGELVWREGFRLKGTEE